MRSFFPWLGLFFISFLLFLLLFIFIIIVNHLNIHIDHKLLHKLHQSFGRFIHQPFSCSAIIHFTELIWFLNFMRFLPSCRSVFLVNFSLHKLCSSLYDVLMILRCWYTSFHLILCVLIQLCINDTNQRTNDYKYDVHAHTKLIKYDFKQWN